MGAPKCWSIGVQGDAAIDIFSGGLEIGLAISTTSSPDVRGYFGGSWGASITNGIKLKDGKKSNKKAMAGGTEFGLWAVKPKDLAGPSIVLAIGAAGVVKNPLIGGEVQVILAITEKGLKFAGVQVTWPNIGSEIELSFSNAVTTTF